MLKKKPDAPFCMQDGLPNRKLYDHNRGTVFTAAPILH